jgi:squalene monooxygenase
VSLLSGLNPKPSVLVAHFFMVALYGVGRLLIPRPSVKGVWASIALIYTACCIILPIIKSEGIIAVFLPFLMRKPTVGSEMKKVASQVSIKLMHHQKAT